MSLERPRNKWRSLLCPLFVSQVSSSVRHLWKIREEDVACYSAIGNNCNKMTMMQRQRKNVPSEGMRCTRRGEHEDGLRRQRGAYRPTRALSLAPLPPSLCLSHRSYVPTHSSDAVTDHLPLPLTLSLSLFASFFLLFSPGPLFVCTLFFLCFTLAFTLHFTSSLATSTAFYFSSLFIFSLPSRFPPPPRPSIFFSFSSISLLLSPLFDALSFPPLISSALWLSFSS